MSYLLDTCILLRWAVKDDPAHSMVMASILSLNRQSETLCICPQNLYEYYVVATRPKAVNGFGLSPAAGAHDVDWFRQMFTLASDSEETFDRWRDIVKDHQVSGKPAHDARLVALMQAHGMTHLLTLNPADFKRYQGISVVHPKDVPLID